jgi:predicted nucleic acid-binding protein
MVAIDSNVLAYLLIDGNQTAHARALLDRDADWHSDAFVLIDLTNVLASAVRLRGLGLSQATTVLSNAQSVIEPGLHAVPHADALALAARYRVSAYDARYLVVARELGTRLVTEDARLRKAAPTLTRSLVEALGES